MKKIHFRRAWNSDVTLKIKINYINKSKWNEQSEFHNWTEYINKFSIPATAIV